MYLITGTQAPEKDQNSIMVMKMSEIGKLEGILGAFHARSEEENSKIGQS